MICNYIVSQFCKHFKCFGSDSRKGSLWEGAGAVGDWGRARCGKVSSNFKVAQAPSVTLRVPPSSRRKAFVGSNLSTALLLRKKVMLRQAAVMLWLRHSDVLRLWRKVMWCVPPHARSAHHLRSKHHARRAHHVPRQRNTSFQNKKHFLRSAFCFDTCWQKRCQLLLALNILF